MTNSSYDQELNRIEQFRERMSSILKEYPAYDTVCSLERWLHSYDNDIGYSFLFPCAFFRYFFGAFAYS